MMKWIFGLLVLVNVLFFAVMQWGGTLAEDVVNPPAQAPLNAGKIKLLPPESVAAVSAPVVAASAPVSAVQVAAPPVAVAAPVAPIKLSCMEWGEFSGADLPRVEKALTPLKLGDRLQQRVVEHVSGYWVYIPPLKPHAKVEQKIAQLKKMGVEDYFVVQESGHWQNAISLGVFKTEEAAQKHLSKLKEQGVRNAKVGERASKLKFTVFVMSRLENALSSQIAKLHKDFAEGELKLVPCN